MNIALVWPKSTFLIDPMYYPPLGLWYIQGMLDRVGYKTEFFDMSVDNPDFSSFDQVWVSGTTPQWSMMKEVFKKVPEKVKLVVGGPIAFQHPDWFDPWADVVVVGEVTLENIRDIVKHKEHLFYGLTRPELDNVPPPSRKDAYRYNAVLNGKRCTSAITSMGCPYDCAFCATKSLYGRTVRFFPLSTVFEDISNIVGLGFGAVQFYDDIFPLNPGRTIRIADYLKEKGLVWRCFFRSDLGVKMGMIALEHLAKCGLVEVLVGVESADDGIKRRINKLNSIGDDTLFRDWCRLFGIKFKASFILGLPGETMETMEATRKWILENRPDKVDVNVLIPMPGTPIWDDPERFGCHWIVDGIDQSFFKGHVGEVRSLVSTDALTAEEITDFRNKLYEELQREGITY